MSSFFKTMTLSCLAFVLVLSGTPAFSLEHVSMSTTSTDFSLKLFREKVQDGKENVVVSPFSAYFALSMTLNGAAGKTREQMAKTLGTTAEAVDKLNELNAQIMKSLSASDKVQLEIANAVYADEKTPFKKDFIDLCKRVYSAEAHSENFMDPAAVTHINEWCSEKTHGKITSILKKLTPAEKMVLLNAIYFKGTWEHQFEKAATQDDQFTAASGDKKPVKMMHKRGHLMYFDGGNVRSISMPYAGDNQRMYIFMPTKGADLAAFAGQFTKETWTEWMGRYHDADVNLSMPRFKIEYSTELGDALKAMGMSDAFQRSADFSNMIAPPNRVFISRVLQKTYMDVNEEGTEAAAVTAVVMAQARAMARPNPPIEFRVDKPFVVALVDEPTHEILFLGTIASP